MIGISKLTLRELLREVKSYEKNVSPLASFTQNIRLALTGNFSTQFLTIGFPFVLSQKKITVEMYESPYNQWKIDLINPLSSLYKFNPSHIILFLSSIELAFLSKTSPELIAKEIIDILLKSLEISDSHIIVVLPEPLSDEISDSSWAYSWRKTINNILLDNVKSNQLTFIDLEPLIRRIGAINWYDERFYDTSKLPFHPDNTYEVLCFIADVITALVRPSCKLVIVDLDDTLWGGKVGDDSWEGISLNPYDQGRHFLRLQAFLKSLKFNGVILALSSKNDHEVVREAFLKRREMILNWDDFSVHEVHWQPKSESVSRILTKLNLTTSGVVFIDDNPVEREEVARKFSDIFIPSLPDNVADRVPSLLKSGYFDIRHTTDESRNRVKYYHDNNYREELRTQSTNIDEFLINLEMSAVSMPADQHLDRVVELFRKTNQFNLTSRRYHAGELKSISKNGFSRCYRLKDKFGDNGIVSVIAIKYINKDAFLIDSWVMSCRVFGRTLEEVILRDVVNLSRTLGAKELIGEFIKTDKNQYVSGIYDQLGFALVENIENSMRKRYSFILENESGIKINNYINFSSIEY